MLRSYSLISALRTIQEGAFVSQAREEALLKGTVYAALDNWGPAVRGRIAPFVDTTETSDHDPVNQIETALVTKYRPHVQEMARAVPDPVAQTVLAASSAAPKVRTLIVDDESLARRALRRCLDQYAAIEVIGESESGSEALSAIQIRKPELVFLDIEMPGLSGLDVVSRLGTESVPVIVFVTGHDQYALDAFRAHALDFVMKPLDERRIGDIMERVLKQVRLRRLDGMEERLHSVLHALEQRGNGTGTGSVEGASLQKLAVKENGRIRLLEVPSIDWIEASGNYVTLHIGPSKHLIRETMNAMERRLEPGQFLRIHRSTMVNIRSVVEFRTSVNGSFLVVLKDQTRLFSSRGYHANVERFLSAMR